VLVQKGRLPDFARVAPGRALKSELKQFSEGSSQASCQRSLIAMTSSRPLRILHLEDDPGDAALVKETLLRDDVTCTIVTVETRDEFARALAAGRFDVILADYSLPSFDGITAQAMAAEQCPATPFIFVSGTLGEEIAVERVKAGAIDYVVKQRLSRLPMSVRRAIREAEIRLERERANAEVRRLNAELEDRVASRTAELGAANRALREVGLEAARANQAKSEFVSRMSHDLRTPLNAILGFAQLFEHDELTAVQRDNVRHILQGGQHLLELVNEVLDITRIESGHLSLSAEPVAVAEVVAHVTDLIRPLAAKSGIALTVADTSGGSSYVLADRQRLSQVLLNLLSNALKYNRPGGRVSVQCADSATGRLRISVADTGFGIPENKVRLLFQPFERLGQVEIEGTGLGLALSKGLAEAMGGILGVETRIDEGSTFWIDLAETNAPALAATPPAPVRAAPARDVAGTVLYIEDNAANVKLVERLLARRPKVQLVSAPTGAEGLRRARVDRPGLILLDLHLPDMPGEDVLRRLWEDATTRVIPTVVLTADATPRQERRLIASGAKGYLTKPFNVGRVLETIDAM